MSEIQTTNQEQAVAQPRTSSTLGQLPANIVCAMRLAKTLSESSLIPKALQGKPADLLVVLLKGEELGLKYMQSLGSIDVIQGKARCSAELTVALVLRSGKAEYFDLVESDAKIATYVTRRVGSSREVQMSYTLAEAVQAQLAGKENWKTHPAAMLRARASQSLARAVYQEVTLGLVSDDEAEEMAQHAADLIETAPRRPRTLDQVVEQLQADAVDATSTPVEQIEASTPAKPELLVPRREPKAEPPSRNQLLDEQDANGGLPWDDRSTPEPSGAASPDPGPVTRNEPARAPAPKPAPVAPITGNKARRF